MKWVEMREVQVGDHLRLRHQQVVVKEVKTSRGDVCFITSLEDGKTLVYAGVDEELVQRIAEKEAVHG